VKRLDREPIHENSSNKYLHQSGISVLWILDAVL